MLGSAPQCQDRVVTRTAWTDTIVDAALAPCLREGSTGAQLLIVLGCSAFAVLAVTPDELALKVGNTSAKAFAAVVYTCLVRAFVEALVQKMLSKALFLLVILGAIAYLVLYAVGRGTLAERLLEKALYAITIVLLAVVCLRLVG